MTKTETPQGGKEVMEVMESQGTQVKLSKNQKKKLAQEKKKKEEEEKAKMKFVEEIKVEEKKKIEMKTIGEEEKKEEIHVEEIVEVENHESSSVESAGEILTVIQDDSLAKGLSQSIAEAVTNGFQQTFEELHAQVDSIEIEISVPQSEEEKQQTETPQISFPPLSPPTSPRTNPLEDQYQSSPLDRGYRSVSPELFMKEVSVCEAPATATATGLSYLIRSSLLLLIQIISRFHEVLEFLNDECKYEFGMTNKEATGAPNYSPFIQTWLIPHFVNRNPSLKIYGLTDSDFFECSLAVSRSDDQNIPDAQPSEQIPIEEERQFMILHRDPSPSPSLSPKDVSISSLSLSDDPSLSTSEFLLLMASYELVMACLWTSLLLLSTISRGCISSLISKSLSLCWMLTITSIQWMVWLLLLPITIPLSLCKKVVFYLFPEINSKRHQGVSPSVCGTL
jgi:hypothetical protein